MKNERYFEKGQALVTLLFFIIIAVTITSAAVVMIIVNSLNGMKFQQGETTYQIAESGADNAMLRLLRNPNYTGEVLTIGQGTANIQVTGNGTGSNPYIILSKGQVGNFVRKIQITATYNNSLLTPSNPQEVF
jgi:uncharacterized membrane protein